MRAPDKPRWFIEIPESSGVCLLGVQCKLWDRGHEPPRLLFEGSWEECEAALEGLKAAEA